MAVRKQGLSECEELNTKIYTLRKHKSGVTERL